MALIYPVQADAPEPDEDSDPQFEELAADLSDNWLVEIEVDDDGEDACFGPLSARAAFELAVELDDQRPEWTVAVVPLHVPGTAAELIALFEDDEED
jgi:hypothetical protein